MILTIIVSVLLSIFIFISAVLATKLLVLRNDLAEFELRAALLEQGIQQALNKESTIEHSEGFLRFLSESRDWAFQYIEESQIALSHFRNTIGPVVEYFDKYGDKMSMGPNFDAMEKVSAAYKELISLLPEEEK